MKFKKAKLTACAALIPPNTVSSDMVEQRLAAVYKKLKLPHGRLELMSGIKERRFWDAGTRPSFAAAQAGKLALKKADIHAQDIDLLLHASVCRDFLEPASATIAHEILGLSAHCQAYDLSNACLGVISAMLLAAGQIEAGFIKNALIISGEVAEPLYEATIKTILSDKKLTRKSIKNHFASLTIGSGAAAVVVSKDRGWKILSGASMTDSASNSLCQEDCDSPKNEAGPLMRTDSEALLQAGCLLAGSTWKKLKSQIKWDESTPSHVFTHQVGSAHKKLMFNTVGIDPVLDRPTLHKYGNTGSSALPMALAEGWDNVGGGENVVLLGIGSGLTCQMVALQAR